MKHDLGQGQILVTGGAGFIGSALVWALNQRGHEDILIADFLNQGDKFKNLVPLRYTDYIEADSLIKKISESPLSLDKITTIFHLGACSSTTETNNAYLIENNFEYTKTLANWALANNIRFIYASSAATYGDGDQGMDDKDENLHKLRPLNMYGYSKHMFDLYAQGMSFSKKIVGLKYFNVFGPNEGHKGDMRSVVNKAFDQIKQTGKISLFKSYRDDYQNGEQMRDFLYIKDAVNMTIHLAETASAGGLYNLGSGEANTWLRLAKAIFQAIDLPVNIEFVDMPETLRAKYQYYTKANIAKLRSSGYQKGISSLENAVSDYVQNYLIPSKYLGD